MPVVLPPSSTEAFSWAYEPTTGLLRGEWAGPVASAVLPGCYGQLLVAAERHDCRFWLLDMQRRNWHDEDFARWFTTSFAAQASQTVGQPLFIAYVALPGQRAQVEGHCNEQLLRLLTAYNVFPFYFTEERLARAWLRDQQAAETPPAGPWLARQVAV
jgi:hypothetical protein